ncbi:MAG: DUF308 domain-containing protein [Paludibacteraceae bacterium]|nr:DUF308 domain-containing protein [Paludibacteraceae bacterium]
MCICYPGSTLLSLAWVLGLIFFIGGCTQMAAWAAMRRNNSMARRMRYHT